MGIPSNFENIDRKIALDVKLLKKWDKLWLQLENYPQVKADQSMITAMQTYNEVEEHIAAARRFYNSAANELKNAVEIFHLHSLQECLILKLLISSKQKKKKDKLLMLQTF